MQDRLQGAVGAAPRQDDTLLQVDDELDAHPAMLPAVQLMERGAALWEQVCNPKFRKYGLNQRTTPAVVICTLIIST